jgi:hypothetical protein
MSYQGQLSENLMDSKLKHNIISFRPLTILIINLLSRHANSLGKEFCLFSSLLYPYYYLTWSFKWHVLN